MMITRFYKTLLLYSNRFFAFSILLILAGCSSVNTTNVSTSTAPNSKYELMSYLGNEFADAENSLLSSKLSISVEHPSQDDISNLHSINFFDGNGNYLGALSSQDGIYIGSLFMNEKAEDLTIMGIHPGMKASEAITILKDEEMKFSSIYDMDVEEPEGFYQSVSYNRNGVYSLRLNIFSNEEGNLYGSIDESDIHMDGIVKSIEASCKTPDNYREIGEGVGDPSDYAETLILEIHEECAEVTDFIPDDTVDIAGENIYGTYTFGDNIIEAYLRPGRGAYPYLSKVCIEDICPYMIYGTYWGMEKDSVMAHLSGLGAMLNEENDDRLIYDIDSGKTLEVWFSENRVNYIGCIENPEQAYEYSIW